MIRAAIIVLAVFSATPALALRCSGSPSVSANYEFAAASEADYVVAVGYLENTGPREATDDQGSYRQMTRFHGAILTTGGFAPGWSEAIEVNSQCQGGGCSAHFAERDGLFFFERDTQGLSLFIGGCGGLIHYDPTVEDMETAVQCHAGQCR